MTAPIWTVECSLGGAVVAETLAAGAGAGPNFVPPKLDSNVVGRAMLSVEAAMLPP